MRWIVFFLVFVLLLIIPAIITAFATGNPEKNDFLHKQNTVLYKGGAMLCIMCCHFMGIFGRGNVTFFTPLGGIGVSVFLILSAYGLNESWNKTTQIDAGGGQLYWWRKRIMSVWLPYMIVQILFYWSIHSFKPIPFLLDITCIKPLYKYGWYLSYLYLWYIVFYVVRKIKMLDKYRMIIFVCISVILFFTQNPIQAEQSFSFFIGILFSEKKELSKYLNFRTAVMSTVLGISALAVKQIPIIRQAPQVIMNGVQLFIKLPLAIGLMLILWYMSSKINLEYGKWIGAISYELYLIHGYVFDVVSVNMIGAIIFVVASIAVAAGYEYLLSKTQKWQKKMLMIK